MAFMENYLNKIKEMLKKPKTRRLMENCVIVIAIGIFMLIGAKSLFPGKTGNTGNSLPEAEHTPGSYIGETSGYNNTDLEIKLKNILSAIEGAGRVDVAVTFFTNGELVPAYDTSRNSSETVEKDSEGGSRTIRQEESRSTVIYEDGGNIRRPYVIKELAPEVKGVVVVADGGGDPEVKEKLIRAVQVLTDIPIHRISVFERKK